MIAIDIVEEASTHEDMAGLLREIADKVEQGYTESYYPHWELTGFEEQPDDIADGDGEDD